MPLRAEAVPHGQEGLHRPRAFLSVRPTAAARRKVRAGHVHEAKSLGTCHPQRIAIQGLRLALKNH